VGVDGLGAFNEVERLELRDEVGSIHVGLDERPADQRRRLNNC